MITVLLLFIIISTSYSQSNNKDNHNYLSGTFNISFAGGATYSLTDYSGSQVDYLGLTSLEYFLPSNTISALGLKLSGGGGYIQGNDSKRVPAKFRTSISFLSFGLDYNLSIKNSFFPYLSVGITRIKFNPHGTNGETLSNNGTGTYDKSEWNYNVGLGFKIKTTDNLYFDVNSGIEISPNDNLDNLKAGNSNDMFLLSTVGLSYSIGGFRDADNDGVEDSKDMCNDTPSGLVVDEYGCPVDKDKDGVPDYLDKCPGTAKGIKVDKKGCPLDSDNDGVADYTDLCPNTPMSVEVDVYGCPLDSDADGVPDYLDDCEGTKAGVKVDKKGCPLDSDRDGVPDYLDQCPGTEAGAEVDSKGCVVSPDENNKLILNGAATFETGSSRLRSSAFSELNKFLKMMKANPLSRWRIEGYTDNTGSKEVNQKLSLERARAVMKYFSAKGIPETRFIVVGVGESNPVASNNTAKGRAQNRRVEITRIK